MYTPRAYAQDDLATMHAAIRAWSFGTLITHGETGTNVTHLPFLLHADDGTQGTLITHLARANPQIDDLRAGAPAVAVFQGPHAFISPSWYENQLTFPTWNYTAVHVRGRPEVIEDAQRIHDVLVETVATYDTGPARTWTLEGMPAQTTLSRMGAIAAVRLPIGHIEGKWKLNQDKSIADRLGVIAALLRQADPQSHAVADLIARQADMQGQV